MNINEKTKKIEQWFAENARDFPWREKSTPWGRFVSECMGQQTQITRVAERWPAMMAQFPTPTSMANQDVQVVLAIWQGLGYYRRARYLKQSAEMMTEHFCGEVPDRVASLLRLPGVGRYTAGAIASIAYHQKEPIVDGNVHRVLCRLAGRGEQPTPDEWSWSQAEQLVRVSSNPSAFNEGMMELGAIICTPRAPKCDRCPIRWQCCAYEKGSQSEIPPPKKARPRTRLHHHAVVLTCGAEIAFEQRGNSGLWANLWQVPTCESPTKLSKSNVAKALGLRDSLQPIGHFEHVLTHRVIEFRVYTCEITRETRFTWHYADALDEIPLASAQRKVLAVHCRT